MYDDAKVTYLVITLLVVVLGVTAYFLQDSFSQNKGTVNGSATTTVDSTTNSFKQKITNILKRDDNKSAATTTTMTIPEHPTGAIIKTNMGDIEVAFASGTAPNTVKNFISLASTNFYDGVLFHRVIRDFMIQAGDPQTKDPLKKAYWGTGGPGYKFDDELSGKEKYSQGTLAMANSGPNTNGSQFFIVTAYPEAPLPPSYTVFGHVVHGMDVALNIQSVQTDNNDRPIKDVIIESVVIK